MVAEMTASGSPMPVRPGPNWRTRLQAWRARQVARPGFRKFVQWLPLSRSYARAQEADLFSLVTGFVQSQILFTTVETGLLGALEAGPAIVADLVRATGLAEDRLKRLLQAAQAVGLVSIRAMRCLVTLARMRRGAGCPKVDPGYLRHEFAHHRPALLPGS